MAFTADTSPTTGRRLFLVSIPRTASNLLVQVLNMHKQPNVVTNDKAGYFFQEAYILGSRHGYLYKPLSQWTDAEKDEHHSTYQRCLDDLESYASTALDQNKILFTKEHAFWFANPAMAVPSCPSNNTPHLTFPPCFPSPHTFSPSNHTLFPDSYLASWHFAFIIRHPALAWPSMYRAMSRLGKIIGLGDDCVHAMVKAHSTFRWTRSLYDWCVEHSSAANAPIILDACDVVHSREAVVRFCEMTGLDPSKVQFSWEGEKKTGPPEGIVVIEAVKMMMETLRASKGIMTEKAPREVDVAGEVEKWKGEFGEEVAAFLKHVVDETMGDYVYLRERRLRCD
ncbi:hypothetical protein QBC34DRAFT_348270 [Podospora aff. communis PSN243]|uniref:Sulfotransferase domain-containing protein n=1 Tax=Podospora aff. communis PSN243 TaxID=3040156 RepID=A0AAV9GXF7_9PEZI|nr:hypothetical protein QBC34DRAFT_348270 [Podospora aff. communis PSN243]